MIVQNSPNFSMNPHKMLCATIPSTISYLGDYQPVWEVQFQPPWLRMVIAVVMTVSALLLIWKHAFVLCSFLQLHGMNVSRWCRMVQDSEKIKIQKLKTRKIRGDYDLNSWNESLTFLLLLYTVMFSTTWLLYEYQLGRYFYAEWN